MQRGFTKLFNTIVTSTIWQEDDKTRIVWITMLAIADAQGIVSASIPGLASVANVELEAAKKALNNLESPDEYSRTKDFDGRRIEPIDGGWQILNYAKYRRMLNEEERKEYKANWIKGKRQNVDKCRQTRTPCRQMWTMSTHAEAEAEANKEAEPTTKTSLVVGSSINGLLDSEWISQLANDSTYSGLDVQRELGKMTNWCKINNTVPTRRRFINWLNRADRKIKSPASTPATYRHMRAVRTPTDEELQKMQPIVKDAVQKLKAQFKMP